VTAKPSAVTGPPRHRPSQRRRGGQRIRLPRLGSAVCGVLAVEQRVSLPIAMIGAALWTLAGDPTTFGLRRRYLPRLIGQLAQRERTGSRLGRLVRIVRKRLERQIPPSRLGIFAFARANTPRAILFGELALVTAYAAVLLLAAPP